MNQVALSLLALRPSTLTCLVTVCHHRPGQAEAVTEPKPSSLPDSLLKELAPRIDLSKYKITDQLLQDL
jgi:hypothetical protein